MNLDSPAIALSSGEPAGIGPDVCAFLSMHDLAVRLAVIGDPDVMARRSRQLNLALEIDVLDDSAAVSVQRAGRMQVLPVPAAYAVTPGRLDPGNADYVLEVIRQAVQLCSQGTYAAMVTAPVQKSVLQEAGVPFTGHTEFLAALTDCAHPVMMLASDSRRIALATTHLALREVADALSIESVLNTLRVIKNDLQTRFDIASPRILVLGLNPHAGEGGTLGDEERTIIQPAINKLQASDFNIRGPVSADSAFTAESLQRCDVVLAMYHDQGLPVLKALDFGKIVNVTLGLPIIRTSVDHGTALSLAGTGRAQADSLLQAVNLAQQLAERSAR